MDQLARSESMLAPRAGAALEYWFFKVNAGPVALIVDWIARRRADELWVRASVHSPDRREVPFDRRAPLTLPGDVGLSARRAVGQIGDIRWELDIDAGDEWIAPDLFPARALRMTDLALVSAPLATFSGRIWVGDRCAEVRQSAGVVSHYWGRQLAPEWWWVSANQFDRPDVAVECAILRTGVWGIPVNLPLAYLYLREGASRRLIVSPPALARAEGTPDQFEIQVQPAVGAPIFLRGVGRDYGDFGEGIVNTLIGDLDILRGGEVIARAKGTAGLERRAPPHK